MRIEEQLKDLESAPSVAVVGTFDGVHHGHRALLKAVAEEAARSGLKTRAFVFLRQPREVIKPDLPAFYLSEFDERVNLLKETGISEIVPLEFNPHVRKMRAEEFIRAISKRTGLVSLIIGHNARMGSDLAGSAEIKNIAEASGTKVTIVGEQMTQLGNTASSTEVRRALAVGDVETASDILGRRYALSGIVVKGDGRGKALGYPTANLELRENLLVPLNGIYATIAVVEGKKFASATSVGVRPTFDNAERTIETYIINFNSDLYGKDLRIEFFKHLRDEKRFEIPDALIAQIREDVAEAKNLLNSVL